MNNDCTCTYGFYHADNSLWEKLMKNPPSFQRQMSCQKAKGMFEDYVQRGNGSERRPEKEAARWRKLVHMEIKSCNSHGVCTIETSDTRLDEAYRILCSTVEKKRNDGFDSFGSWSL